MNNVTLYSDLKNKNILVTGATRGIGKSIALGLAQNGCNILFNYRGELEAHSELIEQIKSLGGNPLPFHLDLDNFEELEEQTKKIAKDHALHGLVNNAAISKDQILFRLKESDIDPTLDINLKAALLLISYLSRSFLRAQNVSIVNVSSIVGLMGNASQAVYAASKAGLIGASKSVAKELASRNIRCNCICPGFIETEMTQALSTEKKEAYLKDIPLKKMGQSSDVAQLVNFLLSEASSYITGEVIKIDGGLYI